MAPHTYLAALHMLPGMTQHLLRKGMHSAQGDPSLLWHRFAQIAEGLALSGAEIERLLSHMHKGLLEKVSEKLSLQRIQVITEHDADFPFETGEGDVMEDVPFLVYIKGRSEVMKYDNMAIVGARRMTPYGERVLQKLIPHLVRCGFGITSGMAKGIDGMAHTQTLAHKGKALAVIGTGIDQTYPREHRLLERNIIENHGCILSEFPLGTNPLRWNFPLRNRIIARLAKAVFVIEAGSRSGSIRTAEWAIEYGKTVYVVPGSIFSEQSMGCHELLGQRQKNVSILSKLDDILECSFQSSMFLAGADQKTSSMPFLSEELRTFFQYLAQTPQSVSEIAGRAGISLSATLSALGQLELYDMVAEEKGGWMRKGIDVTP